MRNDLNSTSTEQISIPSPQTETPTVHNSTLTMNSRNLYLHSTSTASPPIHSYQTRKQFSSYRVAQISENTALYKLQLHGCRFNAFKLYLLILLMTSHDIIRMSEFVLFSN